MKLQHTFKILQQRYFIAENMANIGAVKLKEKICNVSTTEKTLSVT